LFNNVLLWITLSGLFVDMACFVTTLRLEETTYTWRVGAGMFCVESITAHSVNITAWELKGQQSNCSRVRTLRYEINIYAAGMLRYIGRKMWVRNTWKVLKFGGGKGWRISVGSVV
jgi:hypothetical protein